MHAAVDSRLPKEPEPPHTLDEFGETKRGQEFRGTRIDPDADATFRLTRSQHGALFVANSSPYFDN